MHDAHHHYHSIRLSDLGSLNLFSTMRNVADSLFAVLVVVYLRELGYSLETTIFFLIQQSIFWVLMIYPAMRLMNRIGTTRMMLLSLIGNVIYSVLLLTLPTSDWPLWILAATWGFFVAAFWPSFRITFAHLLLHRRAGANIGLATALTIFASGITPGVGGIIASLAGINVVYIVAAGVYIAATIPLLRNVPDFRDLPFDFGLVKLKQAYRDLIANFSICIEDSVLANIWPLYIFLFLPSYAGVGVLSSVAVISAIFVSIYVGRREETVGTKRYLREGLAIAGIGNVFRIAVSNAGHVFGVNLLSGFGRSMTLTPYMTRYYKHIEEEGLAYLCGMQFASGLGWILPYVVVWGLVMVMPERDALLIGLLLTIPTFLGVLRIR